MSLDTIFTVAAFVGGALFLVQLVLQFLGGDGGDGGTDVVHAHDVAGGHHSADVSFKVISLQGLSSFLLMFGLVGLATYRMTGGALASLVCALVGGSATTFVIARIFGAASRLQSSGTMHLGNLVGAPATVTLTVRPGKPGKANVTVHQRMVEVEAVCTEGEFETGAMARVAKLVGENAVLLEKS